jgi:hypothetical protein
VQDFAHPTQTAVNRDAIFHEDHPCHVVFPAVRCSCFRAIASGVRQGQND